MAWPYPALGLPALGRLEVLDARLDTGFDLVVVVALLVDLGEQVGFFALEPGQQSGLEGTDLLISTSVRKPFSAAYRLIAISATDIGAYCFCFISSVTR